jgi:hypothetical protein
MRRLVAIFAGLAMSLTLGQVALASGKDSKNPMFTGVLSSVDADSNAATAGPFTIQNAVGANDAGRAYLSAHPGDVTINIVPGTKFKGPQHLGRTASDYRVGDFVRAQAHPEAGGTTLDGKRFKLFLQRYGGVLTTFTYDQPSKTGTGSVTWTSDNTAAQAWQAVHASNPVNFDATPATKLSGHPTAGDPVELLARPSSSDPTMLDAIHLSASG